MTQYWRVSRKDDDTMSHFVIGNKDDSNKKKNTSKLVLDIWEVGKWQCVSKVDTSSVTPICLLRLKRGWSAFYLYIHFKYFTPHLSVKRDLQGSSKQKKRKEWSNRSFLCGWIYLFYLVLCLFLCESFLIYTFSFHLFWATYLF